jgi:hypothetical protein
VRNDGGARHVIAPSQKLVVDRRGSKAWVGGVVPLADALQPARIDAGEPLAVNVRLAVLCAANGACGLCCADSGDAVGLPVPGAKDLVLEGVAEGCGAAAVWTDRRRHKAREAEGVEGDVGIVGCNEGDEGDGEQEQLASRRRRCPARHGERFWPEPRRQVLLCTRHITCHVCGVFFVHIALFCKAPLPIAVKSLSMSCVVSSSKGFVVM